MTFDDVLEQVVMLLKRQGRVSYPALKIRFSLDDEYLEALKAEIIEAQQLATDENGRVLVWAGNTAEPAAVISLPAQPAPQPHAQQQPSPQIAPLPTASSTPDAERRQLTVMFCDLVDSTRFSSQLDPEDWRDMVRAYQRTCSEIIQRYEGHVAQLLGDGLLVYFGYPQAHEDDAHRAVRTGLGILAAIEDLNKELKREKALQLAMRLGIHTGLVVVGEMGSAGRLEQLALGETPNVAARIQGLAAPNTLVVSSATYRLIQGYFECQDLGAQTLRGVAEPVHLYRVLQESGARGRLDVAAPRGLTPLVGREQEVGLLLERWAQVKDGHGQVVLLTGEGGIGKSRLVQVLKDAVANEPHTQWECRSAEYAQNTALFPLTDLFQRILRFEAHETPDEKLGKLEHVLSQYRLPLEESVPLFAPVLSVPMPENHYPPLNLSPQRQRQKRLETIVAVLLELAERQPVLFIVEDLHWTDPSTLELLNLLIDQTPTASILTVLTCRPTFQPSWSHRSYLTEVTVNRLSQHFTERMTVQVVGGKRLPAEVLQQIIEKTDGVPLFVEELTKAILELGYLKETHAHDELTGTLPALAIPATLQDSLMARLDRLVTAKGVAQMGATIGRQFVYALLQAVSQLDEVTLQRELGRLVEAEIVYHRGIPPQATYTFKHALIQDAAYQSLLKSTRQQYHQRIAEVLEAQFPETAEGQPELLAHHFTEAGLTEKAVGYWQKAGQSAVQRSAHVEAISHMRTGLELLQTLPETPQHLQRELDMHIALGASLIATKGPAAPEVAQTYLHAQHLCAHLDDPRQLFPALRGLWNYSLIRGELQTAQALGEQLLSLAQHAHNPVMLVAARSALGSTLLYLGAVATAHLHFTQGMALYAPQQHHAYAFLSTYDTGVVCHSSAAWTFWLRGYPDQGWVRSREAVTLAQQSGHPISLSFALSFAAVFHQFRREVCCTQERAAAAISLSKEQGFAQWMAIGAIVHGWARVQQGHVNEGIAQLSDGLRAFQATGAAIARPYYLACLAEAYGTMEQPETGHALEIARTQQAKSFELRAATSLACLWQQQGKRQEAHDLLAPVYNWFTEGFDTADLKDAKMLLDELA